ncbi:hypothetical protein HG715_06035 [Lactobacillus acetotolerans]|nr:hypothetical protein HG715_06035 [Lactobacillus acetotolerans]
MFYKAIFERRTGDTYEIAQVNLGFQDLVEGTIYTILIRLERKKWLILKKLKLGPKWVFLVNQLKKLVINSLGIKNGCN